MENTPLEILVTNDDGYASKGIRVIADLLSRYGRVTVLAPEQVQSGMSAAVTLTRPIRVRRIESRQLPDCHPVEVHALTGTPVDCVKMAMNTFFLHRKPHLLVSGINHGSNASVASVYSGTLGAAAEGTIYGVPSIGVSIDDHDPQADFSGVEAWMGRILDNYLAAPPAADVYLNINFPALPPDRIRGVRFAPQGKGMWVKEFSRRTDPHGNDYFWLTGEFLSLENEPVGDHMLLEQGYITIVPHTLDNTRYPELERLSRTWKFDSVQ